jgi:Ca-activated chloride channel family protein
MTALIFLNGGRLWLIVLVFAFAGLYIASQYARQRHVVTFTNIDLLDSLAPKRPGWRRHVVAGCYLVAAIFGIIAIARPVDRSLQQTESGGRILLVFDVSLSMEATDVDPNRLDAAKKAGEDFIDQVDDNIEIGLISFNGNVTVRLSPTLDHRSVSKAINNLQLGEGTAIGDALATASEILGPPSSDDPDTPSGAIVLLSDGETTQGRPTADGAAVAAEMKIPVYSIAFGTADGTVVDSNTGETVDVPVNVGELSATADTTGGKFYEAPTASALEQAYNEISKNLNAGVGDPIEVTVERTWEYTAIALVLLALGWILGLWLLRGLL